MNNIYIYWNGIIVSSLSPKRMKDKYKGILPLETKVWRRTHMVNDDIVAMISINELVWI